VLKIQKVQEQEQNQVQKSIFYRNRDGRNWRNL